MGSPVSVGAGAFSDAALLVPCDVAEGDMAVFNVELSRAVDHRVEVDYLIADGSEKLDLPIGPLPDREVMPAVMSRRGLLAFEPGETRRTGRACARVTSCWRSTPSSSQISAPSPRP